MQANKYVILITLIVIGAAGIGFWARKSVVSNNEITTAVDQTTEGGLIPEVVVPDQPSLHPMSIQALRQRQYVGGDFTVEQTLANGSNYAQYIVSYRSDGLKIYGLLTVPTTQQPEQGFPAVVFVHGYIPPKEYTTTGNYASYQAVLARSGFITFKPDLRGHGNSEGEADGAHFSESYVVDTLHAINYLKQYSAVDAMRIGYWGHSNGGEIGLRALVVTQGIKAASLWAGVVGSFQDMLETYNAKIPFLQNLDHELITQNGLPSENPEFWDMLEPYRYLGDITARVQLQHGTADASVPVELSRRLTEELKKIGTPVEYFEYAGDNHNLSKSFTPAWNRTVEFFRREL
ncbi:MAG: prolyl oligopeptidase family serine peptidase [Candidatus Doudnabacteria bacterium]|nr:prolyl oligopeptidase family serine peptidase [Candidatus Doudnabacteria bacterium]